MTAWTDARFTGTWRHYQELALAAFDADRAAGRTTTHVVAPPGSGKTIVGLEIARRLGAPAIALCPTTGIAQQWEAKIADFGIAAGPETLQATTYQSLCRTEDPGGALKDLARRRWIAEQAEATTRTIAEVEAEANGLTGAAAERLDRELARIVASITREVGRGKGDGLHLADLLAPGARERVDALRAQGVTTVVLDECHHLVSLWGGLIRVVLDALGEVHVIGLTATSPDDMTREEGERYEALLGPVDFTTPTPAVVREGFLAPYQELALFTEPLPTELAWLRERHIRFHELVTDLLDVGETDADEDLSFGVWVTGRFAHRDAEAGDGAAKLSVGELLRKRPAFARAGVRYLRSAGLPTPPDAPTGEGFREPPSIDDWLELIDDYVLRCLRAHPGAAADARLATLADALSDLGYQLTRTGIRPGRSDIDRVLVASGAKVVMACEALSAELDARGDATRALVLCDSAHAGGRTARPAWRRARAAGGHRGGRPAAGHAAALRECAGARVCNGRRGVLDREAAGAARLDDHHPDPATPGLHRALRHRLGRP
jgi:hypothetical protein